MFCNNLGKTQGQITHGFWDGHSYSLMPSFLNILKDFPGQRVVLSSIIGTGCDTEFC